MCTPTLLPELLGSSWAAGPLTLCETLICGAEPKQQDRRPETEPMETSVQARLTQAGPHYCRPWKLPPGGRWHLGLNLTR